MKKLFFLLSTLVFVEYSCTSKKEYIEQEKFVEILSYIHLAEAAAENSDTSLIVIKQTYLGYQNEIFSKFKIDSLSFKNSYDFYMKDPVKAQAFYDKVIEKTQKMQVE